MNDVASVVMKELILANDTTDPFTAPTSKPNAHPASSARITEPVAFSIRRATSGAATATAEIDTSKPPAIMVRVATDAAISRVAC